MFLVQQSDGNYVGSTRRNDFGDKVFIPRLYAGEKNARSAIALRGLRNATIVSANVRLNRRRIDASDVKAARAERDSFGQFA